MIVFTFYTLINSVCQTPLMGRKYRKLEASLNGMSPQISRHGLNTTHCGHIYDALDHPNRPGTSESPW